MYDKQIDDDNIDSDDDKDVDDVHNDADDKDDFCFWCSIYSLALTSCG